MNGQQKQTGATKTLAILEELGVSDIFGYPGGAIMPIYDAIYSSEIKHYLCRHEQGAAFAAIGYARASRKTGVCIATSGPGATNLITGLADAMADSIPIVAITGQVATNAMGSDGFQEVDIAGLSLACTKHCFQVKDISQLSNYITKAFEIAHSGRPGPVLIDIPKDIQNTSIETNLELVKPSSCEEEIDMENIQAAADLIDSSDRPIMYVGGGLGMAGAVADLKHLNSRFQVPSVVTLKGLGCIHPTEPHYLGMLGMHGTKAANLAVQEADLLLVLGARFDDRVTGKLAEFAPNAKIIHMDIDPAEINKRKQADISIIGNLKFTLPVLARKVIGDTEKIKDWHQRCRQLIQDSQPEFDHDGKNIFAPELLFQLSDLLNEDAIVTTDVGQHQMWAAQTMHFNHPSQFITSSGLGTMGFGIPSAIGAQISRPNNQVICISGDGSFMMNVQELATIKRYKLPIKILLIDNSRLGMVRQWQELFFNSRYSETDLSDNPDFVTLASAFDIKAKIITKKNEISSSIEEMLNHPEAYMLHVKIEEMENVWPLVPPETANHLMIERRR